MPRRAPFAGLAVALLLLAACGGSGTTTSRPPATPRATTTTTTTARASTTTSTPATGAAWTTDQADLLRSGVDRSGAHLNGLHASWTSPTLDGQVYAEPLVYGSLVIVATENDTLYGLHAATGQVAWTFHIGSPAPGSALPCGNIDPLGITSTPAIDPASGRLFALAETYANHQIAHELVALDATTGALAFREPADPPGQDPTAQQQRPGLAVANGRVYIAFGGLFGDCGRYKGRVVAASTAGPAPLLVYTVAASNQAAIWAPAGPAIDAAGNVWVATGNGSSDSSYDEGDSVLKLSPTLTLLNSFAPSNWPTLNAQDLDLGSTTPQLLANGLVFQVGKSGVGYLLDASHLGGIGGESDAAQVCSTIGANAYQDPMLYVPCHRGLTALRVTAGHPPSFQLAWTASGSVDGPPIIAGGTVWSISQSDQTLYGLDPMTGTITQRVALGASVNNYARPAVGDGLLVVPTGTTIRAYAGT